LLGKTDEDSLDDFRDVYDFDEAFDVFNVKKQMSHAHTVRIYYHDTDCGGVVYYANYLLYLEEARTEYFEALGISVKELAEAGTLFVVARQEIDYKAPGRYGDVLSITTRFTQASSVRLIAEHEIRNQQQKILVTAKTVMVCVDKSIRPKEIPGNFIAQLKEAGAL